MVNELSPVLFAVLKDLRILPEVGPQSWQVGTSSVLLTEKERGPGVPLLPEKGPPNVMSWQPHASDSHPCTVLLEFSLEKESTTFGGS